MNKWVLIHQTDTYIVCDGEYETVEAAISRMMDIMSDRIDSAGEKAVCSSLSPLEADTGFGFTYEIEGYGKVQAYILEVCNSHE